MERLNLPDVLAKERFDHAILCTFAFEPQFFEQYCLERFKALANENVTVLLDRCVYEELLADRSENRARQANLRYLLHPIAAGKLFHPKLFLLARRDRGLLIVGSANVTRAGLANNAELVGAYRFEAGRDEGMLGLFQAAAAFLGELAVRYPNDELTERLDRLVADAPWLTPTNTPASCPIRLIHNLDEPLWPQLTAGLDGMVEEMHVVSRYFDLSTRLLETVRKELEPGKTVIWTQNGYTTLTPPWLDYARRQGRGVTVRDMSMSHDGHAQPLHAKALAFVQGKAVRLAFGSANFTLSGLMSTAQSGNVEIMCVADQFSTKVLKPVTFFDPMGTSAILDSVAKLETAKPERLPARVATPIELEGAWLEDGELHVQVTGLVIPPSAVVSVELEFADLGQRSVVVRGTAGDYSARLEPAVISECRSGSVVVRVRAAGGSMTTMLSNSVFLLNLQEYDPERSQRGGRRVREAQKSASQFAAALSHLIDSDRLDQLQAFLTYCDIPLIEQPRFLPPRGARAAWTDSEGMRALGPRNLRDYRSLHEAALGFCDRHLRRMKKHCNRASIPGVPNFMHMALAIAGVVRSQVERIVGGLEVLATPMQPDAWGGHRTAFTEYLRLAETLVGVVFDDYLPALAQKFKQDVVRKSFASDMQTLTDSLSAVIGARERLLTRCRSGLSVQTPYSVVPAPTPNHDLIGPVRWPAWRTTVEQKLATVETWGAQ
jgi:hypothetical protein